MMNNSCFSSNFGISGFAKKLVLDPIICVAESQADLYRQYNPDCEIVTHPDDVIGLIPKRSLKESNIPTRYTSPVRWPT